MRCWYGIKGIDFIWHGEWSDPEIEYLGVRINSTIVEDTMWERWTHDDDGNYIPRRVYDESGFCKYMLKNANEVKDLIRIAMKPLAVKPVCNYGGIAILNIDSDYVVSGEDYGNGFFRITKAKIRYNGKGEAYFMRNGVREKINEYMKVGA